MPSGFRSERCPDFDRNPVRLIPGIRTQSGSRGVSFNFVVTRQFGRAEVYIDTGNDAVNEEIFDGLYSGRAEIDEQFGEPLTWERLEGRRACRVKAERPGNIFDREQWPKMTEGMIDMMIRLDEVFRPRLADVIAKLPRSIT